MFAAAMIARKFTMIAIKMLQNSLFLSIIFKQLLLVSYVFIITTVLTTAYYYYLFFCVCMQMSVAV